MQSLLDESISERGNNLFVCEECAKLVFFSKVNDTQYFQFAFTPGNYPAVDSGIIDLTDSDLTEHIQSNLVGWFAKKCNVDGVVLDDSGYVSEIYTIEITWGGESTRDDLTPISYTFHSIEEAEAFLEGADSAVDCFPNETDADDHDISTYSEEEQRAFTLGLEAGVGFSDYDLGEQTSVGLR